MLTLSRKKENLHIFFLHFLAVICLGRHLALALRMYCIDLFLCLCSWFKWESRQTKFSSRYSNCLLVLFQSKCEVHLWVMPPRSDLGVPGCSVCGRSCLPFCVTAGKSRWAPYWCGIWKYICIILLASSEHHDGVFGDAGSIQQLLKQTPLFVGKDLYLWILGKSWLQTGSK